jgi:hypothetical protein
MYKGLLRRCKLVMITSVLFIILTGLAMIAYPGGTKIDRASVHFNIFQNFFSDLGTTITYSGKQNTASNILFISALGSLGMILIYFSKIWRAIDVDVHKYKFIGILSKIFLIICGLSIIGIAFSPWNKYFENHLLFLKLSFVFLFLWSIMIAVLQTKNKKMRGLLVTNIIFILILFYFLYSVFLNPDFGTDKDLEFHSVSQKIIVYISVVYLFIQAYGIKHFLRGADFRRNGMKNFYV